MDIALSESGQDYEILLIENGSQDETWAVMQELKLAHPRIRPPRTVGEHGFGLAIRLG